MSPTYNTDSKLTNETGHRMGLNKMICSNTTAQ